MVHASAVTFKHSPTITITSAGEFILLLQARRDNLDSVSSSVHIRLRHYVHRRPDVIYLHEMDNEATTLCERDSHIRCDLENTLLLFPVSFDFIAKSVKAASFPSFQCRYY